MATMLKVLTNVFREAPKLKEITEPRLLPDDSLTIVVPTYNEESKIENCIKSILKSDPPSKNWMILHVDDCSTDSTVEIVQNLQLESDIPQGRLEIISAGTRPISERWVGKNWACSQAMKKINSSWVLFIDADTELECKTLKRSLRQSIDEKIDLLSLAPRIVCSCLSEWMVQPIISMLLAIGFPILKTNNPQDNFAFAAGPFMLFQKEAYDQIGGHESIQDEVVEDIKLAKK